MAFKLIVGKQSVIKFLFFLISTPYKEVDCSCELCINNNI